MFFLYVMKDKGLPVGEIFEKEIKDIPTSRFSKNLDDSASGREKEGHPKKMINFTDRIFMNDEQSFMSMESCLLPLTDEPAGI
jgi:hypothetical protein